jgi:uncharacterized protein YgbK (DUF1537 family)
MVGAAVAEVLVVADDLTGSNATGALFARRGLRTVTVSDVCHAGRHAADADVIVVNTQTRKATPERARTAVAVAVDSVPGARLVVKRVDTTLRGNIGAEVEAALLAIRRRTPEARALLVPAFPAAGRTTVGGIHLVDGVPVADSEVGLDPFNPVTASRVATLLGEQTRLRPAEIVLDAVQAGPAALARALDVDADVLICDAVSSIHLNVLARAAAGGEWLSVDSGPFGAALATAQGIGGAPDPVLVVAGSVTGRTREQLALTERVLGARYVDVTVADLDPAPLYQKICALLAHAPVAGIRMVGGPVDLALAAEISRVLGEVARRTLAGHRIGGVYATGGDVSVAVVQALGAEGFAIETEVQALAVTGRLVGGGCDGLPFAAKGGLIGDRQAAVDCIEHLRMVNLREKKT